MLTTKFIRTFQIEHWYNVLFECRLFCLATHTHSVVDRAWQRLLLCVCFTAIITPAFAQQSNAEQAKAAAVMSIVTMYLLEGDSEPITETELELNQLQRQPIRIREQLEATFSGQSRDIELCFNLSGSSAAIRNLSVSINGVRLQGSDLPRGRENCYTLPENQQLNTNSVVFTVPDGLSVTLSNTGIEPVVQSPLGLRSLIRSSWDERAVRKVLKIFAFGGHATDAQIRQWADIPPRFAIAEMLNFSEHNLKLSPLAGRDRYRQTASRYGEFTDFVENYLSSSSANIPISLEQREHLELDGYLFDATLGFMVATRGLNPFRQLIGFWETNYHLAVNLNGPVTNPQMAEFYDVIMRAHESGVPYQRVLAEAAKAAAPAAQYGHENNEWINGVCFCNDDFAREIHQLYFGIFGEGDTEHHENVTIPNTASLLTGMPILYDEIDDPNSNNPNDRIRVKQTKVTLNTASHHTGALQILRRTISGSNAFQKIDALVEHSIEHPDSLKNLPIMIISGLADDNLNDARKNQLRAAWASMGSNKQFLRFIRTYATSDMFHAAEQRKYMSSFARTFYLANKFNLENIEAFNVQNLGYPIDRILRDDDVRIFRPTHNVFGGQTSLEASDTPAIFEQNYNRSSSHSYRWSLATYCEDCDQGQAWNKDWGAVIPRVGGVHKVSDVAAWLWNHVVGNTDNYTVVERAHLVMILGAVFGSDQNNSLDLGLMLCIREDRIERGESPNNLSDLYNNAYRNCRPDNGVFSATELAALDKVYSADEITNNGTNTPHIPILLDQIANTNMPLLSRDPGIRAQANRRVNFAMAFIFGSPFVFVEAGE